MVNSDSLSITMPIAVFGGSGATGKALLVRMVQKGLAVRVLVRKAATVGVTTARVEVVEGALSKPEDVLATLQGCGSVICVFGPRPPYIDVFCEQATANIVDAMQRLGIRRLVCQTGGMIGDYRANRTLPFQWMSDMFRGHSPQIANDRVGQEHVVMDSGLDWTIIKPPRLTDGAAKGKCCIGTDVRLGMLSSITRADLADFLITETLEPQYIGQVVFIRNG